MSKNEWLAWALMALLAAFMLWLLPGCASEREAPIYKWRVAYGFESARPD